MLAMKFDLEITKSTCVAAPKKESRVIHSKNTILYANSKDTRAHFQSGGPRKVEGGSLRSLPYFILFSCFSMELAAVSNSWKPPSHIHIVKITDKLDFVYL